MKSLFHIASLGILFFATSSIGWSQNWLFQQKIKTYNETSWSYPSCVSVNSDFALIGAKEDSTSSGAVYTLLKDSCGNWYYDQKITANIRWVNDNFGWYGETDENHIIIGTPNHERDLNELNPIYLSGAIYFFENNAGVWTQTQKLVASDRQYIAKFGYSVEIDSNWLIASAPWNFFNTQGMDSLYLAGAVYMIKKDNGTWVEQQKITPAFRKAGDKFGESTQINGDQAIAGSPYHDFNASNVDSLFQAGAAYMMEKDINDNWSIAQKIVASDRKTDDWFGFSVTINGNKAAVGAPNEGTGFVPPTLYRPGAVYTFKKNTSGVWIQQQKIVSPSPLDQDNFGWTVEMTDDHLYIGQHPHDQIERGYIYKYDSANSSWELYDNVFAFDSVPHDHFGTHADMIDGELMLSSESGLDVTGQFPDIGSHSAYFYEMRIPDTISACPSYASPSGNYVWSTPGTYIDTIIGGAVNGCDSVLVIELKLQDFDSLSVASCYSYTVPSGDETYFNSGIYYDTVPTSTGCDSILTITLTVNSADNGINQLDALTLSANAIAAQYQWLNCDSNFAIIPNATSQQFIASQNGSYAVQVTENGCTDTSACMTISDVGYSSETSINGIKVYPVPTNGMINIRLVEKSENVRIDLISLTGQVIHTEKHTGTDNIEFECNAAPGVYWLNITTNNKTSSVRIVRQ